MMNIINFNSYRNRRRRPLRSINIIHRGDVLFSYETLYNTANTDLMKLIRRANNWHYHFYNQI